MDKQVYDKEISRLSFIFGAFDDFIIDAIMSINNLMKVQRVSFWLLDDISQAIVCRNMIDKELGPIIEVSSLYEADLPRYFKALKSGTPIVANDAQRDKQTNEFTDIYLVPFNITSMLDMPVFNQGQLIGIICCEHCGEKRVWLPQELLFVKSIAEILGSRL